MTRTYPTPPHTPLTQDAADGMGVELTAFTEHEGKPGPVELSGKVTYPRGEWEGGSGCIPIPQGKG